MKSAYILHGCCDEEEFFSDEYPSSSNSHWIPWLQKQLLIKDYLCQTPEMPKPYKGDFKTWKNIFDTFPINESTSLIGFSCGGGFLLRWLTENDKVIDKLVLVAPGLDTRKKYGEFLQGPVDPGLKKRINEMHIFYSTNESNTSITEAFDLLKEMFPTAKLHIFEDRGHFTLRHMKTEKFPELANLFD